MSKKVVYEVRFRGQNAAVTGAVNWCSLALTATLCRLGLLKPTIFTRRAAPA